MQKNKYWLYVALTSLFEMIWIYGFNTAETWWHWLFVVIGIAFDFYFLSKACEGLPTGTVYAIFAAVGAVGTVFMDYFLFGGSIQFSTLFFIGLLFIGVIGLNLADNQSEKGANE
ncbi:MAG TPA: multidrug efflux SMR transporter [Bacilli bacterium]|nr:multidrug efflux SMR transporter [Bacilli bacterium]